VILFHTRSLAREEVVISRSSIAKLKKSSHVLCTRVCTKSQTMIRSLATPSVVPGAKPRASTMQPSREDMKELLSELREACHRPLFEEIVERQSKRIKQSLNPRRSWDKLLAKAATLLPFMSIQEYGIVSRVAAILFVGFLIPTSTGNDFFVRTAASHSSESHQSTSPL
jgi:hypothetical protein